ncbi:MAG TPA: hypothetical protein PLT75_11705 [Spirochaetota bacterium]|nr:hypothetical protein [Spirochaetota bacterium]
MRIADLEERIAKLESSTGTPSTDEYPVHSTAAETISDENEAPVPVLPPPFFFLKLSSNNE